MALRYYANAPATTLESSVSAVATSITVVSTAGLPISYPYTLILDRGTATEEAVSVTAAGGTTLTVTRGIDGTTAFAHAVGATVEHGITAQDVREPNTHVNSDNGVHGVTGDVVGTSDTQTLTGKTIDLSDNTLTGTKAEFEAAVSDGNPVWEGDIGVAGSWAPVFTNGGAACTHAVSYASYIQIGNWVFFSIYVAITGGGPYGGPLRFDLPIDCLRGVAHIGQARESAATGISWSVHTADVSTAQLFRYDNGVSFANGEAFSISGAYEVA